MRSLVVLCALVAVCAGQYGHGGYYGPPAPPPQNGVPQDTPEVAAAKAAHFSTLNQALTSAPKDYSGQQDDGSYKPHLYEGNSQYNPQPQYNQYNSQPQYNPQPQYNQPQYNPQQQYNQPQYNPQQQYNQNQGYYQGPQAPPPQNGVPQDTPEVAAARAAHFEAFSRSAAPVAPGHYGGAPQYG